MNALVQGERGNTGLCFYFNLYCTLSDFFFFFSFVLMDQPLSKHLHPSLVKVCPRSQSLINIAFSIKVVSLTEVNSLFRFGPDGLADKSFTCSYKQQEHFHCCFPLSSNTQI